MAAAGERTVDELFALASRRAALRIAELEGWARAGIEALVAPVYVTPSAPIGMAHDFTLGFVNVARYNILDLPAGAVPVTQVRSDELVRDVKGRRDRLEKRATAIESASLGMPVGVQVVAKPYQEHVALAVMAAIEAEAKQKPDFPRTPVPA
jgi:fatty acid amide hydrolase